MRGCLMWPHFIVDWLVFCGYKKPMNTTFSPAKDAAKVSKHGLSLADFSSFDGAPHVAIDDRFDYGEVRYQARGRIGGKGYCVVFTVTETGIHLISFRRAHEKEMRRYE